MGKIKTFNEFVETGLNEVVSNNYIENCDEKKSKESVKRIVRECIVECGMELFEGVDINKGNKVISFNPNHQNNIDTNDYIHPYIIQNNVRGETVLSIFERKDNDNGTDGNPLVYALKGVRGWTFNNPKYDITALLRRFVAVTTNLQVYFDTVIMIPSNNELNNRIFSYLIRMLSFDNSFLSFFRKLTVSEVYENYYDEEFFDRTMSPEEAAFARLEMNKVFSRMTKENNGIFSYKMLKALAYRDSIEQSLKIEFDDSETMKYRNAINDKNVLVLDDTVASGKTLSDSATAIREMFSPKSITFLTLFSPKESLGAANIHNQLK